MRADLDSRYYSGVYPYVTGVIRGTEGPDGEEVLSLGDLFEQDAYDNATGVAAIISAAEALNSLIEAGKLPRPRRTIRVLGMSECYGTMYYLQHNQARVKRTVAAMCIDSPAGLAEHGRQRSTPGFSTRTPPSPTWMLWPSGWRRNTIRRLGGPGVGWSTAVPPTIISAITPSEFLP